jgi:hypothetical protein
MSSKKNNDQKALYSLTGEIIMSWNYRILKRKSKLSGVYYAIYEVYYNKKGKPICYTTTPVYPCGDTLTEFKSDMKHYRVAMEKPILTENDFVTDKKLEKVKTKIKKEKNIP